MTIIRRADTELVKAEALTAATNQIIEEVLEDSQCFDVQDPYGDGFVDIPQAKKSKTRQKVGLRILELLRQFNEIDTDGG